MPTSFLSFTLPSTKEETFPSSIKDIISANELIASPRLSKISIAEPGEKFCVPCI